MTDSPNNGQVVLQLTDDQLKRIVQDSVRETLVRLGVDAENPLEMQRDFQHLRDWRMTVTSVRSKSLLTMTGIIVAGLVGLFWLGFRENLMDLIHGPQGPRGGP